MTDKFGRNIWMILAGIFLAGLFSFYFLVDPASHLLVPKCPAKILTGYSCPSCGLQRALHALMHGELLQAIRFNFFAVYSVPYFLAVLICYFSKFKSHLLRKIQKAVLSPAAAYLYIATYCIWWILRNILHI